MTLRINGNDVVLKYDRDYKLGSGKYDIELNPEKYCEDDYFVSLSIKTDKLSAVLICSHLSEEDSAFTEDSLLVLLRGNVLYKIDTSSMEIVFRKVIDLSWESTFSIYSVIDGYIVHGELEITKLDKNYNVVNTFSGKDIFATPDDSSAFEMKENEILLHDFYGNSYWIDYDCNLIKQEIIHYIN